MITWKKIGVRGKPVYLAEWPTFIIEIVQSGPAWVPFVKTRDGLLGYGLGLYSCLDAAKADAEKHGQKTAEKEALRIVNKYASPPPIMEKRERKPVKSHGEF